MENLQINETEIKTIDAVVTDIETRIARLVVNSQENLTIGGDILAEIKQEIKATEAKHDEYKKPLNLLKDKLAEVFNPRIKQLNALKDMIENNMLPYQLKIIKEREEFAAEARKKELVLIQERADAALAKAFMPVLAAASKGPLPARPRRRACPRACGWLGAAASPGAACPSARPRGSPNPRCRRGVQRPLPRSSPAPPSLHPACRRRSARPHRRPATPCPGEAGHTG